MATVPKEQVSEAGLHPADPEASGEAIQSLLEWLARPGHFEHSLADQAFATVPLTRADDERARTMLWEAHRNLIRAERPKEMEDRSITVGEHTMPFCYTTFGEKQEGRGRSLWISMHGGGGTTEEVNTSQWHNQQTLYQPAEGVYCAPRDYPSKASTRRGQGGDARVGEESIARIARFYRQAA